MTPLSDLFTAAKARAKLLKKQKRSKWLAKNREIINEKKRLWRAKHRKAN